MKRIKYPSHNFDERPNNAEIKFLILHSTECDLKESLRILTDAQSSYPVSSHYIVAQNGDIYELVEEKYRAWHAGKESHWGGSERLNASSIGVEIVNSQGNPFSKTQMESVFGLSREIITKHRIKPSHVLAHSDIALGRKLDPGPLFDWKWLAEKGIGLHPEIGRSNVQQSADLADFFSLDEVVGNPSCSPRLENNLEAILKLQDTLKFIGYGIESSGKLDDKTRQAVRAFQMKFRQKDISGEVDVETLDLLRKYKEFLRK